MLWKSILLVAIGGAVGSVCRFLCQKYSSEVYPHAFPLGTFIVNISGCLLIGLLFGAMEKGSLLNPEWRLLLVTGFCGGFTTFSSFAAENIQLLKSGQVLLFALYTAGSVVLGILATWCGIALVKAI